MAFCYRAIPLLRTWHFLDFERLSFSHETRKLDLNILYQCILTYSWHNQKTLPLLNYFHLQNFKNVRCWRDAKAVTSATHVFELFKDENSWVLVAEVSSDCVNYIPGHIDTKYLDQASWIYDRMAASQRLKNVTSATMESPYSNICYCTNIWLVLSINLSFGLVTRVWIMFEVVCTWISEVVCHRLQSNLNATNF